MSSAAAPFGIRPVYKSGGTPSSLTMMGTITSGYNTAIGEGDAVKLASGVLTRAVGTNAGDTIGIVGCFMGVEYTDSNGRRQESNQWIANLTGTNIVAYYTADPYITYEVQANGSIAQSNVGNQIDLTTVGPANTTIGISGAAADTATISNSAQRLFRIVGLTPAADNAFGDAFTIIQVQIAKHQFVTPVVAFA